MVAVLRTCLFRNRPTHWNTGTIASADGSHALFESRNLPVNYGRVQIGIAAYLSPGETRRRWSMCVLSIYRGIFSHRTRRDYGYGWDPYVDDFCIFIVGTRGFIFFFFIQAILAHGQKQCAKCNDPLVFWPTVTFFFFFFVNFMNVLKTSFPHYWDTDFNRKLNVYDWFETARSEDQIRLTRQRITNLNMFFHDFQIFQECFDIFNLLTHFTNFARKWTGYRRIQLWVASEPYRGEGVKRACAPGAHFKRTPRSLLK